MAEAEDMEDDFDDDLDDDFYYMAKTRVSSVFIFTEWMYDLSDDAEVIIQHLNTKALQSLRIPAYRRVYEDCPTFNLQPECLFEHTGVHDRLTDLGFYIEGFPGELPLITCHSHSSRFRN